jgi:transcription antitermination factor NusA-like protein
MRGSRVQAVSNELNGERVDVILYNIIFLTEKTFKVDAHVFSFTKIILNKITRTGTSAPT